MQITKSRNKSETNIFVIIELYFIITITKIMFLAKMGCHKFFFIKTTFVYNVRMILIKID